MNGSLQQYYNRIRMRNAAIAEQRRTECEKKNPRIASLREEQGEIVRRFAAGKITNEQAQSRLGAIAAEQKNLLIAMGLGASYLDPIYTCPKCRDTGEIGKGRQKPCSCALKKMQEELTDGARINTRETFAAFNPAVYATDTQRSFGVRCKAYCEKYVAALPHPEKPNLLFLGAPGLGKSFFANAIAYGAIERGIETRKVTAYRFIQDVMDGISNGTDAVRIYANLPFLVIDDLGTEPMVPNVTKETLFSVLNERIAMRLPTIVISNQMTDALSERYDERIVSRLTDKSVTAIVVFSGKNLRTRQS